MRKCVHFNLAHSESDGVCILTLHLLQVNAIHSGACGGAELVVGGDPAGWVIHAHNGVVEWG